MKPGLQAVRPDRTPEIEDLMEGTIENFLRTRRALGLNQREAAIALLAAVETIIVRLSDDQATAANLRRFAGELAACAGFHQAPAVPAPTARRKAH